MGDSTFGRYIRKQRIAAGLSLRAVAGQLGISHVFLGEVERGIKAPFKKDRWEALVKAVPGITKDGLECAAATTRPVQIPLDGSAPMYRDLALALARRVKQADLSEQAAGQILSILEAPEE